MPGPVLNIRNTALGETKNKQTKKAGEIPCINWTYTQTKEEIEKQVKYKVYQMVSVIEKWKTVKRIGRIKR